MIPTSSPTQSGLNGAFGTTGSGGSAILTSSIIIVLLLFGCGLIAVLVYKRMNKNVQTITKQMTELVEERERQKSVQSQQSPQSNDMSINISAAGVGNGDNNN